MGTEFEKLETTYNMNSCSDENKVQTIKYVYKIVGEPTIEGSISYYKAQPTAIYVSLNEYYFNKQAISCDSEITFGEFYDVV